MRNEVPISVGRMISEKKSDFWNSEGICRDVDTWLKSLLERKCMHNCIDVRFIWAEIQLIPEFLLNLSSVLEE